jgi:hypothetical protein
VVTQNGIQRCRFESLVKELEKFFYGFDVLVLGGGPGSVTDDVSRVVNQVECFLKCQRFKAAREFILATSLTCASVRCVINSVMLCHGVSQTW